MKSPSLLNAADFHYRLGIWRGLAAVLSGLLLSAAFPPLGWDLCIWIAFVPLALLPVSHSWRRRLAAGYLWGYVHAASSLLWLNEVGFGAGFLLALYCALFPMAWYALFCSLLCHLQAGGRQDPAAPPALLYAASPLQGCLAALPAAAAWTTLEWLRSWLFTGFPWNQLGICLYRRPGLLQICTFTGVPGLSFLIVLVNLVLAIELGQLLRRRLSRRSGGFPWHLAMGALAILPAAVLAVRGCPPGRGGGEGLLATAVQGGVPQCRAWSEKDYVLARDAYSGLTRRDFRRQPPPDLYVWPECAVPASLDYPPYHRHLDRLLREIPVPFLIGATQYRNPGGSPGAARVFNSAFYLSGRVAMEQYYDKMHRVPFGEYVPGSRCFPRLGEWLDMGRDLTPGRNPTLFRLPRGALAGVNICFEDVFPGISREFVRRGANLLMTLTNDAWYNESAGSEQHLSHIVFRAVENRRPLLRSGNNSDTCLVTPDGRIHGIPRDPDTGSRFFQCAARYRIPVADWGTTFYTRHGDVFAILCNLLTLALLGGLLRDRLARKRLQLEAVSGRDAPPGRDETTGGPR